MGRMYTVVFESVAVAALQDFFEVVSAADAVTVLHSCVITQESEAGDTDEEMFTVVIQQGATTSGSGGTAPTAIPVSLGDSAFGGSVEVNNLTEAADGSIVSKHRETFNIRVGFHYHPDEKERLPISPSARLTITLISTVPGQSTTMSGTIVIEEIGG